MKTTLALAAVPSITAVAITLADYRTARSSYSRSTAILAEASAPSPGGRDTALAEAESNGRSPGARDTALAEANGPSRGGHDTALAEAESSGRSRVPTTPRWPRPVVPARTGAIRRSPKRTARSPNGHDTALAEANAPSPGGRDTATA